MNTTTLRSEIDVKLEASAKELKALREFVGKDETRSFIASLFLYRSDGGATYVATDGHTLAVRRSGTHRTMAPTAIAKLPVLVVSAAGEESATPIIPANFAYVLNVPIGGELAEEYGVNPAYLARVGLVEAAAGARAADDYAPRPGTPIKQAKAEKAERRAVFVTWKIPSGALDPWYWKLECDAALWEGIIAPRRL